MNGLINEFMDVEGCSFETIDQLWPVLKKIQAICNGQMLYVEQWMWIAAGLYRLDEDMIQKAVVNFINYHNNLKQK